MWQLAIPIIAHRGVGVLTDWPISTMHSNIASHVTTHSNQSEYRDSIIIHFVGDSSLTCKNTLVHGEGSPYLYIIYLYRVSAPQLVGDIQDPSFHAV